MVISTSNGTNGYSTDVSRIGLFPIYNSLKFHKLNSEDTLWITLSASDNPIKFVRLDSAFTLPMILLLR